MEKGSDKRDDRDADAGQEGQRMMIVGQTALEG